MRIWIGKTPYDVDYEVESHGSPASYHDPGDPPELYITHIYIGDQEVTDEVWDSLWRQLEDLLYESYIPDDDYYVEADFR